MTFIGTYLGILTFIASLISALYGYWNSQQKEVPGLPAYFLTKYEHGWDVWINSLAIGKEGSFLKVANGKHEVKIRVNESTTMDYSYIVKNPFEKLFCIDGIPDNGEFGDNPSLVPINLNTLKKVRFKDYLFSFFQSQRTTMGFLHGSAGASGGSSQTLYLFDTRSDQYVILDFTDCVLPHWIDIDLYPPRYASVAYRHYIGSHASSIGLGLRIDEVFSYNRKKNRYERDADIEKEWFYRMYRQSKLSRTESEAIEGYTFEQLNDDKYDGEKRRLAVKFMDFMFYSIKTGNDHLAISAIEKLDVSLKEEFLESFEYMKSYNKAN